MYVNIIDFYGQNKKLPNYVIIWKISYPKIFF